jgi:DNA-binding transcriptional ArsR family regulator
LPSVKAPKSVESALAAVVAHPTRAKALNVLVERKASPNQIALELGEEVGNVSYHVKKLVQLGVVELVEERKVRGAVEHFYRAINLAFVSDEEWAKLSIEERRPYTLYTLQLGIADAARAVEANSFDARPDRYLTRTRAVVDEEGWSEFNELHAEMIERTMEIKAASAARRAEEPQSTAIPVMQIAMFFEEPCLPAALDQPQATEGDD